MAKSLLCPHCGTFTSHCFDEFNNDDHDPWPEIVLCARDDGLGCEQFFIALPDGRTFYWTPTAHLFPLEDLPARFTADDQGNVFIQYIGNYANPYTHLMAVASTQREARDLAYALNDIYRRFDCREHGSSA